MEQLGCTYLKSYLILLRGAKYHTLRLSDGFVRRLEFFSFASASRGRMPQCEPIFVS
jgi:hypothetical protein